MKSPEWRRGRVKKWMRQIQTFPIHVRTDASDHPPFSFWVWCYPLPFCPSLARPSLILYGVNEKAVVGRSEVRVWRGEGSSGMTGWRSFKSMGVLRVQTQKSIRNRIHYQAVASMGRI